jgi:hypothetical protein
MANTSLTLVSTSGPGHLVAEPVDFSDKFTEVGLFDNSLKSDDSVRCWIQYPVDAAHDYKKRIGLFFRLLQAAGLTDLQRKLRQILTVDPTNSVSMNWGRGVK